MDLIQLVIALVLGVVAGLVVARVFFRGGATSVATAEDEARRIKAATAAEVEEIKKAAQLEGKEAALKAKADVEEDLRTRRAEMVRAEEALAQKERDLDRARKDAERRASELDKKERSTDGKAKQVDAALEKAEAAQNDAKKRLEEVAGLSVEQARARLEDAIRVEAAAHAAAEIKKIEDEAREQADEKARTIVATAIQRYASEFVAERTVAVVPLPSDDMKGRLIGREGRNIRALETLTGIDFIIDDTPGAVILSGFDGVRREIARLTLEKLLQDGRIHPARIEEAYFQARSEIEQHIAEVGEQAIFEAGVGAMHPELTKLLGRLHYRTSYGQNVLAHSIECAHLAALIASELGASAKTARRAALLHDIGKAVTHEVEGPHALVGGQIARKYKESEAVAHAMEAHHNEVEMQTVEAVVVQVADALSGARPGARGESLEQYVKRLRNLEDIAMRHPGVEKVHAMQAGREVRVIVSPHDIDDDGAALLSHQIAREVEKELEYPGQIKVTVIRESRATDYAK